MNQESNTVTIENTESFPDTPELWKNTNLAKIQVGFCPKKFETIPAPKFLYVQNGLFVKEANSKGFCYEADAMSLNFTRERAITYMLKSDHDKIVADKDQEIELLKNQLDLALGSLDGALKQSKKNGADQQS